MHDSEKALQISYIIDRKYQRYAHTVAGRLDEKIFTARPYSAGECDVCINHATPHGMGTIGAWGVWWWEGGVLCVWVWVARVKALAAMPRISELRWWS